MTNKKDDYDDVLIKNVRIRPRSKKYVIETNYEADEEFVLDEDTIVKFGIIKGKVYTLNEFKKILKEIKLQKLFNKTLNYLSYSAHSKHEIYAYLDKQDKKGEYSQEDKMAIVKRLKDLSYVDDLAYAKGIVNYYRDTKGKSYIINFLKSKLVENEIIETVVEIYDDEEEVAYKILDKIHYQYRKYPISKQHILMSQKLLRDGFSMHSINYGLDRINFIDESDDTLDKDILKQLRKYENKDIPIYEKKQKILASLINKGYSYSKISDKLKEYL